MQLEGSLKLFPLSELMIMIASSSVTGVLEIGDHAGGRIFYHDGRPCHAVAGGEVGLEAVCRLFELKDAPFCFTANTGCSERTLYIDPWDLVAFAERRAEMWAQVRQHIPSLDWVPVLHDTPANTRILISEAVWPVVAATDGHRSVTAIAEYLGQVPVEVGLAVCELISQGLASVHPPRLVDQQKPPPSPPARGLLDRLMANHPSE